VSPSIVIVSHRSLFAEGVAAWLGKHLAAVELTRVDPWLPDAAERIVAARPSAVLLDSSVPDVARLCHVEELFRSLPGLKVVRLNPAVPNVQIMTSQQYPVRSVRDLAEIIMA
jgi:DNA-binding NarL/FixJ family response regulator